MNRLANEKSAYLRHLSHQKIDWYPWSDEPFNRAKQEDKPIFLSSGAIWCHWCHVMSKECFENEDVAELLNEHFICIKLDRDERPDIDRRYQHAVVAMGAGGGWPLSVFLTPDGKPFFGGTYFPLEDRFGRPGFKKVLITVRDFYMSNREEVTQYADKLLSLINPKPTPQGEIDKSMIDGAVREILSEFDLQNGGFGRAPKFPICGAIEFLINRYFFTKDDSIGYAVKKTLEAMAKGGFYDQIGGGFHRYSTDQAWIIPHFEKMTDDNAWLLRNYIDAYAVFGDPYFREVAEGIISFVNEILYDSEGGFYASQDADVTPDDEGGYFTWTEEEFKKILNPEEYEILSMHLWNEKGTMHHNETKRVLFVATEALEIANRTGMSIERVKEIINSGKETLLKERSKRKRPFIDRTLYTSLNGLMVSSYLRAFRILKDDCLRDVALKSLKRVMKMYFINDILFHSEGVKAMLDDYIFLIEANISAYEVTGDTSYLNSADKLMKICIQRLWDEKEGGFFDTEDAVLGIRLKVIEDTPHPSANSVAIMLLLKLYYMTDNERYLNYAEKVLKAFSLRAKGIGTYSAYYHASIDAYFHMLKLTLHTSLESELTVKTLSSLSPYNCIVYAEDKGYVLPCLRTKCYEPIYTVEDLERFLLSLKITLL